MWSEENSGNVKCTMWREDDDMTRRKEKNIEKSDRIWTTAKLPPQKMNTQISRSTRRKKKKRKFHSHHYSVPSCWPAADASPSPLLPHRPSPPAQPPTHHPLLPTGPVPQPSRRRITLSYPQPTAADASPTPTHSPQPPTRWATSLPAAPNTNSHTTAP